MSRKNKPAEHYVKDIHSDIDEHVLTTLLEGINLVVSDVIDAFGDEAPNRVDRKTGEKRKITVDDYADEYGAATKQIAKTLSRIRSEAPYEEYTTFRYNYINLLKELALGESVIKDLTDELMIYKFSPKEIKKLDRSIKNSEKNFNNANEANKPKYLSVILKDKDKLKVLKQRYEDSELKLRSFLRYHVKVPRLFVDLFGKIEEVYRDENLEAATHFTEAMYFPFQGMKKVSNPAKTDYLAEVLCLLNKGKSAKEINEFATKVNEIIATEYKEYKLNDYILERSTDLAVMGVKVSHVILSADKSFKGDSK